MFLEVITCFNLTQDPHLVWKTLSHKELRAEQPLSWKVLGRAVVSLGAGFLCYSLPFTCYFSGFCLLVNDYLVK